MHAASTTVVIADASALINLIHIERLDMRRARGPIVRGP